MTSKVAVTVSRYLSIVIILIGFMLFMISLVSVRLTVSELIDADDGTFIAGVVISLSILLITGFILYKGIQIQLRIRRFRKYVHLISYERKTKLNDIAMATGKPVAFVRNDILKMIRRKYFKNVQFSEPTQEVMINGQTLSRRDAVDVTSLNVETVICRGCGALLEKKINASVRCEYCGTISR